MELLLCQVKNITSLVLQIHVCIQVVRHERLLIYLVEINLNNFPFIILKN